MVFMIQFNKLKETLDIFIPRTQDGASITLTMTADSAKQLYEKLGNILKQEGLT